MGKTRKEEGAPELLTERADGDDAIAILTQAVTGLQAAIGELAGELSRLQAASDVPAYATPEDTARRLGVGRDTVYRMLRAKTDPMPHVKEGNRRYVNLEEAYRYMKGREIA